MNTSISDELTPRDAKTVLQRLGIEAKGNGWKTIKSPLREEKNPSFGINLDTGAFKDHANDDSGDIVTLSERILNMDNTEAIQWIREQTNLTGAPYSPSKRQPKSKDKERKPFWTSKQKQRIEKAQQRLSNKVDHQPIEQAKQYDCLTIETLQFYGVGILKQWQKNWLAFPYESGCQLYRREDNAKVIRSMKGSSPGESFFGSSKVTGDKKRLFIAKSPRECMLIHQLYGTRADVVGLATGEQGNISNKQRSWLKTQISESDYTNIAIILDCDVSKALSTSKDLATIIKELANGIAVSFVNIYKASGEKYKDITDCRRDGMPDDLLWKLVRNGEKISEPNQEPANDSTDGKLMNQLEHKDILNELLKRVENVNFEAEANTDKNLQKKHFVVIAVEKILELAKRNRWGLCKRHDFIYLYNGAYWSQLEESKLETFLGEAADKMSVDKFDAYYHKFRADLLKQFMSISHLPTPDKPEHVVLVNLRNGTAEINPESDNPITLREPKRADFITYQLPFRYNKRANAPRFKQYLDEVLPDINMQKILAEYLGYVFIQQSTLKLEKALILYGTGANGKSVFFEVANALLGNENVSTYSLQSLTNTNGYYRAKLANRLVNYASEINGSMETSLFKQLVSGEPVEARLPYGEPFTLTDYAKLIFNCNELPTDVEHTNAFFRRFMIVPFDVTIPEDSQDKELAKKIIDSELSGVFNWVLEGLGRILQQKDFTKCEAVTQQSEKYRKESDNVQMFIAERKYQKDHTQFTYLKELYSKYKSFCEADGYYPTAKRKFSKRLENAGYKKDRKTNGTVFYVTKDKK